MIRLLPLLFLLSCINIPPDFVGDCATFCAVREMDVRHVSAGFDGVLTCSCVKVSK